MSAHARAQEHAQHLLEAAGAAGTVHPSGTLLAHLQGTHDRLERWGCPGHLCMAGLYHSVYGTEAFQTVTLADRDRVREHVGAEAEELVHLYCVIVRASLYENLDGAKPPRVIDRTTGETIPLRDARQLADLLTLDLANRLDQLPRISLSLRRLEADRRRYEKAVSLLPPGAVTDFHAAYRRRSLLAVALDTLWRGARRVVRRLRGEREISRRSLARFVQRWYRRATVGVTNPFDSAAAAQRYAAGRPDFHDEVARQVAAFLGAVVPVERALDVGCGTGQSTRAMSRLARRVVGLDVSEFMVREARAGTDQAFALGKAEALPLANTSVDLILASAAFHWFDQRRFLNEARRVARPGAWLVVYDNGFSGTIEGAEDSRRWHKEVYLADFPGVPRHATFSPRLAARAGFAVRCEKRYVNRVEMDAEALVRFIMTQSNVIAAIAAGRGSADEIARRLRAEVEPFFRENGRAVVRHCVFGGPLWIAAREK